MNRATDDAIALLAEHGGRLHALLTRLTLRTDVAEDLMQDLFCKLVESDRFAKADSKLPYAIRMATNLAFDYRRLQRRLSRNEAVAGKLTGSDTSPLSDLMRREALEQLLDAIGRLPRSYRDIIVLRYLEQQDYTTISRQLGKSPHQVRALGHKAITKLRGLMDQEAKRSVSRREPS